MLGFGTEKSQGDVVLGEIESGGSILGEDAGNVSSGIGIAGKSLKSIGEETIEPG